MLIKDDELLLVVLLLYRNFVFIDILKIKKYSGYYFLNFLILLVKTPILMIFK